MGLFGLQCVFLSTFSSARLVFSTACLSSTFLYHELIWSESPPGLKCRLGWRPASPWLIPLISVQLHLCVLYWLMKWSTNNYRLPMCGGCSFYHSPQCVFWVCVFVTLCVCVSIISVWQCLCVLVCCMFDVYECLWLFMYAYMCVCVCLVFLLFVCVHVCVLGSGWVCVCFVCITKCYKKVFMVVRLTCVHWFLSDQTYKNHNHV